MSLHLIGNSKENYYFSAKQSSRNLTIFSAFLAANSANFSSRLFVRSSSFEIKNNKDLTKVSTNDETEHTAFHGGSDGKIHPSER